MSGSVREKIEKLLLKADIKINGDRAWDLAVHNDKLFERIIKHGSIGLGEAYMEGWWDTARLDEFSCRVLKAELDRLFTDYGGKVWQKIKTLVSNPQSKEKAFEVGGNHYDVGNDLYEVMLDDRMVYTCGFWDEDATLDKAQENKLNMVCQILDPDPGDTILDIGCGWGSFAQFAAEEYEAEVVGLTVSEKQAELARKRCTELPVEIRLQDYRDISEPFDHVVSLGMFEHVGTKNYRTFFNVVDHCLSKDGVFVLHTIGGNRSARQTDPWIDKYIFPNSCIPSIRQIGLAMEDLFVMEDWANRGLHYDKTLMAWYQNFSRGWEQIKDNYSERFRRMWTYYLLMSAGSFRARKNNQWQIVLTKKARKGSVTVPTLD